MDIQYNELWPTQIWVVKLPFSDEKLNDLSQLLIELDGYSTTSWDPHATLLDGDYPLLKELKSAWATAVDQCLVEAKEKRKFSFFVRSWANYMQPYNWSPPHIHGSILSSALTISAAPASGTFIVGNSHPSELLTHDLGKRSFMWERECIPGELIVFSGHVMHQVTPNLSDQVRISCAANIRID